MSSTASQQPGVALARLAPVLLLLAAVLLLFRDTALAMGATWSRSGTYEHAFLVPPIVVWLVWRRRELLVSLPFKAEPWVLLPVAAASLLWLLGELASVNPAMQLAFAALLILAVPAVAGMQVAKALTFPLLFLLFAVPVGDFMVPYMMEWTADFTVLALQLTGVPVLREGMQFVIPSGNWSVVEACSGVRYLIASFMVGTLFAYLNYRSTKRRVIFMAFSLLVPVIANWLRAYMIVMLGHLSDNRLATGVDHLIYGWMFFGVVIAVMFVVGARWTEPGAQSTPPVLPSPSGATAASEASSTSMGWWVGSATILLLVCVQWGASQLTAPRIGPAPMLALPDSAGGNWTRSALATSHWVPQFTKPATVASGSFASGADLVGVQIFYYRNQGPQSKLVSFHNTLVDTGRAPEWTLVSADTVSITTQAGRMLVRTADVAAGAFAAGSGRVERLRVWHVYWVGGIYTTSDARAKLQQALNRLLGRGDDGAVVFIYTAQRVGVDADEVLERFTKDHLDLLSSTLRAADVNP
jgi:exosortase A